MKFKTDFLLPTKDFKESVWEALWVEMPESEELLHASNIEFKVKIPDFMFDELADTEPQFKTVYDVNNGKYSGCFSNKDITSKFKKTQTATMLEILKDYIAGLTQHILDKHSVETETMTKKIFINFHHSSGHSRNELNGAYRGIAVSQRFNFFTGYKVMTSKFSSFDRTPKKQYISKIYYSCSGSTMAKHDTGFKEKEDLFLTLTNNGQSVDNFEKEYIIIDWTQEREDYCKSIQDTFIKVNNELEEFLKDIDNKKIDFLIENNIKAIKYKNE